jgi:hypothetical protein
MRWKLCETPIETQIAFYHTTMQLNHTMRERLWDPMKLCIEGDIYFIPLFHILETRTVKPCIETGISTVLHSILLVLSSCFQWSGVVRQIKQKANNASWTVRQSLE